MTNHVRREFAPVRWRKSSYSGGSGTECVEIAVLSPVTAAVRDSKNAEGPALSFSHTGWTTFVSALRAGNLD